MAEEVVKALLETRAVVHLEALLEELFELEASTTVRLIAVETDEVVEFGSSSQPSDRSVAAVDEVERLASGPEDSSEAKLSGAVAVRFGGAEIVTEEDELLESEAES